MTRAFAVLLLVYFMSAQAYGQAGVSYLALCHKDWNCAGALSTFRGQNTIVTGWLENTFGTNCQCADRILKDPRPKIVRIHLTNSPALRNGRSGRYEVFAGESVESANSKIIKRDKKLLRKFIGVVKRVKSRLNNVEGLTCYVSPCLECDLSKGARRVLLSITRHYLPNCVHVDNPYRDTCLSGSVCEGHGSSAKYTDPCIADLDGEDGSTIDLAQYRADSIGCIMRLYWEPWLNCIAPGGFVDPRERICSYGNDKFRALRRKVCRLS